MRYLEDIYLYIFENVPALSQVLPRFFASRRQCTSAPPTSLPSSTSLERASAEPGGILWPAVPHSQSYLDGLSREYSVGTTLFSGRSVRRQSPSLPLRSCFPAPARLSRRPSPG